jgi:hypothetical protein
MVVGVVAGSRISVNGSTDMWATGTIASSKGMKPILVTSGGGGSPLAAASGGAFRPKGVTVSRGIWWPSARLEGWAGTTASVGSGWGWRKLALGRCSAAHNVEGIHRGGSR